MQPINEVVQWCDDVWNKLSSVRAFCSCQRASQDFLSVMCIQTTETPPSAFLLLSHPCLTFRPSSAKLVTLKPLLHYPLKACTCFWLHSKDLSSFYAYGVFESLYGTETGEIRHLVFKTTVGVSLVLMEHTPEVLWLCKHVLLIITCFYFLQLFSEFVAHVLWPLVGFISDKSPHK